MKNFITEARAKNQYNHYVTLIKTLGENVTPDLIKESKFWEKVWKNKVSKRETKAKTRYLIVSKDYQRLSKEDQIEIIGSTPIEALRKHFPNKLVETCNDRGGNIQVIVSAVTYVNGVPHYGYNPTYRRFNYVVREKNLFEKLYDIHYKKS